MGLNTARKGADDAAVDVVPALQHTHDAAVAAPAGSSAVVKSTRNRLNVPLRMAAIPAIGHTEVLGGASPLRREGQSCPRHSCKSC